MKEKIEEKNIREIARVLCDAHEPCSKCVWRKCYVGNRAVRLYNAGYRKQEWISVADRLPEEGGEYLVFGRTFGNKKPKIWICECISIGSVTGWCNNAKKPIVEAWMPLPEPPKKGGAE
jgi:hypothetical protein